MEKYLQYAEEQESELIRSFWFGKFLQTLTSEVLLSCRKQGLPEQQKKHITDQATTPPPLSDQKHDHTHDHESVIFQPLGRAGLPLWVHVQRAERCMQSHESSLSPAVHRLVVAAAAADLTGLAAEAAVTPPPPPASVLRPDLTLEWSRVATYLGSEILQERTDYAKGAVKCAALAIHVCSAVAQEASTHWDGLFTWTGTGQLFEECVQLLQSSSVRPDHTHLCLLLSSAALERALGDVYLSISRASQCPSLLRDLLTTRELEDTFGSTAMCCLRCLIGPPSGLNLRNVLWHGFAAPGEVSPDYGYLVLAITATLGKALTTPHLLETTPTPPEIVHRAPVTFPQEPVIAAVFPALGGGDLEWVEQLFSASSFIPPPMLPLWLSSLTAFREERYCHSLVLLLPGLEHGLRRVFACVNHCPQRALTAESTVLYTTFDEILSPVLPDLSPNSLQSEIGVAKMECLLDVLVHPEGPRLRDRISHGEVDVSTMSKTLASHVVSVAVIFCAQYCLDPDLCTKPAIEKCLTVEETYTSLFHPLSLLKRELLGVLELLEGWSDMPVPGSELSLRQRQKLSGLEPEAVPAPGAGLTPPSRLPSLTEISAAVGTVVQGLSRSADLLPVLEELNSLDYGGPMMDSGRFSAALRGLVVAVWGEGVSTLHCPRPRLELAGLMRKVVNHTAKTLTQVKGTAVQRYEQYQQKQLRSRRRHNYEHLLASLPLYRGAVCLLVVIVAATVSHLHLMTETETTAKRSIKFHKKVLQVAENLFSQTSPSKNRWEEADTLALTLAQLNLDIL